MSSQTTESTIEVDYTLVSKKKNNKRKKKNSSDSDSESNKKAAISELQLVILKNNDAKPLASFNPIAIDFGLIQASGVIKPVSHLKMAIFWLNAKPSLKLMPYY